MATTLLTTNSFTAPIINGIDHIVPRIPEILFGILAGIVLINIVTRVMKFLLTFAIAQIGLRDVIVSVAQIVLWLFLIIKTLEALGFDNIVVFFTGSIAALGIAMAAGGSTLISDIVAGLFLARDTDFNVGDEVLVGEGPTQGVIASMDARRVRLRDGDGILHIIPNSLIERKEWVLLHRRGELTTLAKAARTIKQVAVQKATDRRTAASKRNVRFRDNHQ